MIRFFRSALVFALAALVAQSASAQESKAALATRQKLKQKITVDFKEVGTAAIFSEIKGEMDKPVNFKLDNATGVSNNTKLSYKAKDKAVELILNEISDKGEFGWIVISNVGNNKVDGWVVIRKNSKGKERGYEVGKEPKTEKGASRSEPLPRELTLNLPLVRSAESFLARLDSLRLRD